VGEGRVTAASPDGPATFRADRILLATGTREKPRSARLVSGERPLGILNTAALQSYVHLERLKPFQRPVIVGTELVAMSAVLTCLFAGIRPVAVLEQNSRPTARFPFWLLPSLLGIPIRYGTGIAGIEGKGRVRTLEIASAAGPESIECDGLLFTGEFTPEAALARSSGLEIDSASGGPCVDPFGRTSQPHIFAAGNLLRPVETAGWCWAEGKGVAASVLDDLGVGLPSRDAMIAIHAGSGIKLVVPQAIDQDEVPRSLPDLQVRLDWKLRGTLVVSSGGNTIWSRAINSAPERRILIPIARIPIPPSITELTISAISRQAFPR
jgi:pyruvate/2-oxoglutarate dehydrogenase complex dihydrolipoamide dehydrogenase (E3) component